MTARTSSLRRPVRGKERQEAVRFVPMRLAWTLSVLLPLLCTASSQAQLTDLGDPFQWKVHLEPETVQPGQSTTLKILLQVDPDHFIYRDRTEFNVAAQGQLIAGTPIFATPESVTDPFDGTQKAIYRGKAAFEIPLQVASDATPGTREIQLSIRYQGCSSTVCFMPKTLVLTQTLTVREDSPRASVVFEGSPWRQLDAAAEAGQGASAGRAPASAFAKALDRGIFWALVFVFLGGVLTSLTPCVYPLIPITVSLFGARESPSRLKAFLLSATYVLGIATMYSALGLAAAASGTIFGQFMTNVWIMSVVALVFVAFGASMLGAFEIQLPVSLQQRLSRAGGKGFAGAFTMGLFGGIVAAPCTGPALGAVLAYVATTQNLFLGFWLLFTFALGLGLLFLLLGTFSGTISRLPKSGAWMESIKSVFAIVLFAFALYFLKEALPALKSVLARSPAHLLAAVILLLLGVALGGVHRTFSNPSRVVRLSKGAGVALMTVGLFVGVGSLSAAPRALPGPRWVTSEAEGFRLAREQGKPVMIDFWADWCAACKELDHKTYADPRVRKQLEDFITIKLDLTHPTPEGQQLTAKYDLVGLPTVVFFDRQGHPLPHKRLVGFLDAEAFVRHVEGL